MRGALKRRLGASGRAILSVVGRRNCERIALQVRAPCKNYQPRSRSAPVTLKQRWTDIEWRLWEAEESFRATFFGGEAFPCF